MEIQQETRQTYEAYQEDCNKYKQMMKEYNREKLSLEETRQSYNDEIDLLE